MLLAGLKWESMRLLVGFDLFSYCCFVVITIRNGNFYVGFLFRVAHFKFPRKPCPGMADVRLVSMCPPSCCFSCDAGDVCVWVMT